MIGRSRRLRCGIALWLLLALTACHTAGGLVVVEGVDGGPPVFVNTDTRDSLTAIVRGTLAVDRGCFVLTSGGGSAPVVWPAGTRPGADGRSVVLSDDRTVAAGEEIESSGGYHMRDDEGRWEDVAGVTSCPASTGEIAVLNGGGEVIVLE